MGGFAVKRFGGNDFDVHNHHISVVCGDKLSVVENLKLPFDIKESVHGDSCRGLLYFSGSKGKIIILNLATKEMKALPPPVFEPHTHNGELLSCGLGYDAKSRDSKVVRYYIQSYDNVKAETYKPRDSFFELYSFKRGFWQRITTPVAANKFCPSVRCVYVGKTGCCYWTGSIFGLPADDDVVYRVLFFDFASESFGHFRLPATSTGRFGYPFTMFQLVECRGSLGALSYRPENDFANLLVELFIRKGTSWDVLYAVCFGGDVHRALGLKDDHLLILDADVTDSTSCAMVYDFDTNTIVDVNMFDYRGSMHCISYGEATDLDSVLMSMFSPIGEAKKKVKKKKKSRKGKG